MVVIVVPLGKTDVAASTGCNVRQLELTTALVVVTVIIMIRIQMDLRDKKQLRAGPYDS
jgi:hypothetical protein